MITKLIMLRLIITLAVCVNLINCINNGESNSENMAPADGKDPGVDLNTDTDTGTEDDTRCYVCNSNLQDGCEDHFDLDNAVYTGHSILCRDYFKNPNVTAKPPPGAKFFCTKSITTFEFPDTVEPVRIVRQCSFEPGRYGWAGCYYTANPYYQTTVCKCEGEKGSKGCNSAGSIASSLFLFVTGLVMLR